MTKKNVFSLVSAVGRKYSIPGGSSSKKYYQRNFEFEELTSKVKDVTLLLKEEEIKRLQEFYTSYHNEQYYFACESNKLNFTFKNCDIHPEKSSVHFHIDKSEKLVYPEIILT